MSFASCRGLREVGWHVEQAEIGFQARLRQSKQAASVGDPLGVRGIG